MKILECLFLLSGTVVFSYDIYRNLREMYLMKKHRDELFREIDNAAK